MLVDFVQSVRTMDLKKQPSVSETIDWARVLLLLHATELDADMVRRALDTLDPEPGSLLFIENVGNLVCPAMFDLGEHSKVVVISVTEGTDKPLKYPYMFAAAGLVVINKTDLLPYVDFDVDACAEYAQSLNPGVKILPLPATQGGGVADWYSWIDIMANRRQPESSPDVVDLP